jgi:hypothetical protein
MAGRKVFPDQERKNPRNPEISEAFPPRKGFVSDITGFPSGDGVLIYIFTSAHNVFTFSSPPFSLFFSFPVFLSLSSPDLSRLDLSRTDVL